MWRTEEIINKSKIEVRRDSRPFHGGFPHELLYWRVCVVYLTYIFFSHFLPTLFRYVLLMERNRLATVENEARRLGRKMPGWGRKKKVSRQAKRRATNEIQTRYKRDTNATQTRHTRDTNEIQTRYTTEIHKKLNRN